MFPPFETTYVAELEVELERVDDAPDERFRRVTPEEIARAAIGRRTAVLAGPTAEGLDDAWFGSFDETRATTEEVVAPTRRLRRLSDWLLRRAA